MSYTDFRYLVPQFTAEKGADGRSTVRAEYQQIFPRSFMVYDIAALQALYGADATTMSGNNTYFFDPPGTVRTALYTEGAVHYPLPVYVTLWDGGGEDTIDLSATKHKNIVRLKPGSYLDIDFHDTETQIREQQQRYAEELGTNYYDSWVRDVFTQESDRLYTGEKALGIAYGTVIENVIGGSADDIFYDNQVDNKLFGGEGNDIFYLGEGGYDTIDGGHEQDTVILPVSRDTVTMQQSGTETIVVAEHFAVQLIGVSRSNLATVHSRWFEKQTPEVGLLALGKSDFEAIEPFRHDRSMATPLLRLKANRPSKDLRQTNHPRRQTENSCPIAHRKGFRFNDHGFRSTAKPQQKASHILA